MDHRSAHLKAPFIAEGMTLAVPRLPLPNLLQQGDMTSFRRVARTKPSEKGAAGVNDGAETG